MWLWFRTHNSSVRAKRPVFYYRLLPVTLRTVMFRTAVKPALHPVDIGWSLRIHGVIPPLLYILFHGTVRFQVLKAVSMIMTVFWDVAPWSLVGTDRRFRRASACIVKAPWWWKQKALRKHRSISTRLQGITSQKTVVWTNNVGAKWVPH
jgi:hypothetical protein